MPKTAHIRNNGNYVWIEGMDEVELAELASAFTFRDPDSYMNKTPPYRYFITGGLKAGIAPKGLVLDIVLHLKRNGYMVDFKDMRFPIPYQKIYPGLGKIQLRPYQQGAVKMALDKGSGIIKLPTASGKSAVISYIIRHTQQSILDVLYIIICPRSQLLLQFRDEMLHLYGFKPSEIGLWDGTTKDWDAQPVLITTRQSITKSPETDVIINQLTEKMRDRRIMMIVDECHEARGETLTNLLKYIDPQWRFGFTGSLPRGICDLLDVRRFLGTVIYSQKTSDLIAQGYLPPLEVIVMCLTHNMPDMEYDDEVEALNASPYRNAVITKIARYETTQEKNVLILVDRVEHGRLLQSVIPGSVFLHGKDKVKVRYEVQKECENTIGRIIIATTGIFSMGINIKKLHVVVLTGITSSKILLLQSVGRGLREHATKDKLRVYDMADSTKYSQKHMMERLRVYRDEDFYAIIKKIA